MDVLNWYVLVFSGFDLLPLFTRERGGNVFPRRGPGSHRCACFSYKSPASACVLVGVCSIQHATEQTEFTNQDKNNMRSAVCVLASCVLPHVDWLWSLHSLFSCLFLCFSFTFSFFFSFPCPVSGFAQTLKFPSVFFLLAFAISFLGCRCPPAWCRPVSRRWRMEAASIRCNH